MSRFRAIFYDAGHTLVRPRPEFDEVWDFLAHQLGIAIHAEQRTPFPDVAALSALGWRSVSFVKGNRSCVLLATPGAPNFIRNAVGRVVHRNVEDYAASNL